MRAVVRRGSIIVALAACTLGGCYPDFQFGKGSGGASSSVVSSTGSTTAAHSATATTSTHASSSSSPSSASSSSTGSGPPCAPATVPSSCAPGQACCFYTLKNPPPDTCNSGTTGSFGCGASYLPLECNTDAQCPGKVCCAVHDWNFPYWVVATECRSSCSSLNTWQACDPTKSPHCTNCKSVLGTYYTTGAPAAPYDAYGECQ